MQWHSSLPCTTRALWLLPPANHRQQQRSFASSTTWRIMSTKPLINSDPAKRETEADGSFKPSISAFRGTIGTGGEFEPARDRYHLYVSYACPFATRTLIVRHLKGLESIIPITVVSPRMSSEGWAFASVTPYPGAETDPCYNSGHLRDLYLKADPNYSGRITVPMLWDQQTETVVNNESSEIIRMFNTGFNSLLPADKAVVDLYPEARRAEIDKLNSWVYDSINVGVYKAGFATDQKLYETSVRKVFEALDEVEKILQNSNSGYLVGNTLTEADIRFWVTAIRFDVVYVGQFKCNIGTIRGNYPAINGFTKRLYWTNPAFKQPTNFDHIKQGYYWSMPHVNPTRIVPSGPIPDIESL